MDDFEKLTPEFDWNAYFGPIGIAPFDTLNVVTPDFFKALNALLPSEPLESWKSYLRWQVLHGEAATSKPIFDENFGFFRLTLAGQKQPQPRWRQCTTPPMRAGRGRRPGLGEAELSARGQSQHGQAGRGARKITGRRIRELPWMSDETQKAAEEKLAMIRNKIGYPEKWRDYSSMKVDRAAFVATRSRWPSTSATTTLPSSASRWTKESGT